MKVETVTIKTENGPVIISKSDFDDTKHELWVASEPKSEDPQPEPKPEPKRGRGRPRSS